LAILIQAKLWDQDYEWWAHHHLAIRYGIDPSVPDDLRTGNRPTKMQPDEGLVYDFCMELSTTHRVSDATYAAISASLSEQALADLTVITGVYVTISMILNVAEAVAPADDPLPFGPAGEPA
jgi:4-carboxymuconolactone decarboxylase